MSGESFKRDDTFIKHQCLELAQWLAPGEAMSAQEANLPLAFVVARIAASPSVTPVQMALIAISLADHVEASR